MIRAEHLGHTVRIVDVDGKGWKGKVVELEGPEDSESGEIELGIDYADGITMFTESEIVELSILDENIDQGNSKGVAGVQYHQFDEVKFKDGRVGTIMDTLGPDYIIDVGETEKDYDTIMVKAEEIEGLV